MESPTLQRVELDVDGMTCAACANRIERKVNKIDGLSATVNYATERAVVTGLAPERADVAVELIRKAGYDARVVDPDDPDDTSRPDRAKALLRRLLVAAILTLPLGNLTIMCALVPSLRFPAWQWVCVALAVPVVFWCAWPFHRAALRNLRSGSTSMDTLVSIGVLAAFFWSVVSLVIGDGGSATWLFFHTDGGADALYLEVAAAVTTFLLTGRYFEARARRRAASVLGALNDLAPLEVRVVRDGVERVVAVAELRRGETFVVRAGERVAADGTVREGRAGVDTSMMTGEPTPLDAEPGTRVLSGTIVLDGALTVTAEQIGASTQVAQMATLAERAQARKANVQKLVDRVVAWFVPAVLVLAVLTLVGWLLLGPDVRSAVNAALSVVIIACPCALGLATPTALMVGVGRAGQLGIVIKGPDALEASGAIDTVVLDKTGTLTTGEMRVVEVRAVGSLPEPMLRALVAAVEQRSEHPVGRALAGLATDVGDGTVRVGESTLPTPRVSDFTVLPGRGASAVVEGRTVLVGNPALLAEHGLTLTPDAAWTTVGVAVDGHLVGVVTLDDTVKQSAAAGVARLRELGLRTVLLTGDAEPAARRVAETLGLDEVVAGVLPSEKAAAVDALRAEGRCVAMVGDGINDAAALASADLGLALLSGTDLAMRSADLVLVRQHLGVIADAIVLSRATLRTIRGNLVWAFAYNVATVPLAAAGLLNPLIAGLAMSLSSVFVVTNSLRLRNQPRRSAIEDEEDAYPRPA